MENLEYLDASSITSDNLLMKEMIYFKFGDDQQCIGIPLLPEELYVSHVVHSCSCIKIVLQKLQKGL